MQKLVVVLGAGASYDASTGEVPTNEQWRPPLAQELFQNRENFWGILEGYPGAKFLQSELGALARSGSLAIEEKLREYATHSDLLIREHFKEVPLYIRDVVHGVSRRYLASSGTGTYAHLVKRLLSDMPHDTLFVSLNYDDLLEQALVLRDSTLSFQKMSDYIIPEQNVKVIKVHGSINWVRLMQSAGRGRARWEEAFAQFDPLRASDVFLKDIGDGSRGARLEVEGQQWWAYPAITAPVAGKSGDFVCPQYHVDTFRDFVKDCDKYLFIGTSGLDSDVLDFLAKHAPERAFAGHVGAGPEAKPAAVTIESAVPSFRADPFKHFVYEDGFASYVASAEFESFLQHPREDIAQGSFRPAAGGPKLSRQEL